MTEHEMKAQMLDNIIAATSVLVVSKKQAIAIVGGVKHLEQLIESGKLSFSQTSDGSNSKWVFRMSEVLKFAKYNKTENWYQRAKRKNEQLQKIFEP